ncbi:chloroplast protein FOR GROWTH AND FERTILITY 2 [Nicotiana tabacum]|uniref:Chloroplast protein FOR GROWTH AND FERTILITY 2 n=2 Tax=Nicotiana TaxID=4085 RepID=A0A1S3ZM40_TOBAC|nr:PREDICTED: uncharacterized protein LOC104238529 [Nicotiana sylvestris]XP_016465600.1 PREDICTED: uncharacterized protein LOC107788432 [Nicotiana tabacum]
MEKLIYSTTTPFPSKLHLKPSPSLPRIRHVDFNLPSSLLSLESRRVNNSLSFKCLRDSSFSVTQNGHDKKPFTSPGFPNGSGSEPDFLKRITERISQQNKVLSASTIVLLSAVFVMLIHPVIVSPAFASFQAAAKTGGPVAAAVGSRLVRNELLSSAWTGFFAGCLHTLSGPDHLAALAPLSIGRTRMESAAVGALWGCGHDAGQLIFGLLFLLLKDRLHIEVIRTWGTRVVGFTLLVIGAMGIREASEAHTLYVALENGESDVSVYKGIDAPVIGKKKKVGFATFATGIVHGLQPDALMIILPALALPSRLAGAAFLGMFLVGTVMAMGSYTAFIGSCSQALKDRIPRITEKLTWASSLVAIGLGLCIIISQFFGFSLY